MKTILSQNELLSVYIKATEISNQGVLWVNEKGVIKGSNTKFAAQLEYSQSALVGKIIFEINPHLYKA